MIRYGSLWCKFLKRWNWWSQCAPLDLDLLTSEGTMALLGMRGLVFHVDPEKPWTVKEDQTLWRFSPFNISLSSYLIDNDNDIWHVFQWSTFLPNQKSNTSNFFKIFLFIMMYFTISSMKKVLQTHWKISNYYYYWNSCLLFMSMQCLLVFQLWSGRYDGSLVFMRFLLMSVAIIYYANHFGTMSKYLSPSRPGSITLLCLLVRSSFIRFQYNKLWYIDHLLKFVSFFLFEF